jgi:HPt (histidine-containing phosphotransfer) domain-containing protein
LLLPANQPAKLVSQLLLEDASLRDLVQEFVEALPQRLEELRRAYESLDWDQLAVLAHRLKGAAGSYGYPDLSRLAAEMEEMFRLHQAEHFAQWLDRLRALIVAAKAGLESP